MMESLLSYGFLQRAFLAGIFIGIACALLGLFLILRKDAMIGHGLAHVTFGGVALGLFLNLLPLLAALAVALAAAIGIMKLKEKAGLYGDTAIGIFSSAGMAAGIILVSLSQKFNVDLLGYLFGDILAIEPAEVWLSTGLAVIVLLAILLNYHRLIYATFAPEAARASGVKTRRLELLLTILTAVTVVLGMKVVGLLMVTALLIIPAAAGLQAAHRLRTVVLISTLVSLVSVAGGLAAAVILDLPASASIVVLSFLIFGMTFFFRKKQFF